MFNAKLNNFRMLFPILHEEIFKKFSTQFGLDKYGHIPFWNTFSAKKAFLIDLEISIFIIV